MLELINSDGLGALVALLKGFIAALSIKRGSCLDNLILMSQSKIPSSAGLLILS